MTKNWSKQSIVDAYNLDRRDFSREYFCGLDLRGITLSEADLSEANLSGADLSEANLSGADLSGADLRGADLSWADLSGADLSWADLTRADLRRVDLTMADLRRVDLTMADLTRANLSGANLSGADIDFSAWPLRCGSLNVKVDKKIAVQLMYHACALDCDDPEYREARAKVLDFANQMHRNDVKRLK